MQTRAFLSPLSDAATTFTAAILLFFTVASQFHPYSSSAYPFSPSLNPPKSLTGSQPDAHNADLVSYFCDWFMSRNKTLIDRIFEILHTQSDASVGAALSGLNLALSERLILDVLSYEKRDVLSCLKFFDWVGRQPGFHHTRVTFNAIFWVISKS